MTLINTLTEILGRRMAMLLVLAGLVLGAGLTMAGCETAEGFGEDVEDAGEEIQDAAD